MLIPIRRARRACVKCRCRPALARSHYNRVWRVMKDHDLCRQCWRSLMDSVWAWRQRWAEPRRRLPRAA